MRRKLFYLLKYLFIKNILCQEDYVEPECYDDLTLGTFIIRFLKLSSEQIVKYECFQALQTELFRIQIFLVEWWISEFAIVETKISYYEFKQLIGAQQQPSNAIEVKKSGYFVQQLAMNAT